MIEVLIVVGVLWFLSKNSQSAQSASGVFPGQQIIHDSIGGALSGALGSKTSSPGYFATGNPSAPPPQVGIVTAGPSSSTSGTPTSVIPVIRPVANVPKPVNVVNIRPAIGTTGPGKVINPVLANRPPVVVRNSPEVSSAPWTKAPIRVTTPASSIRRPSLL
jgi:hypothetical protein